MRLFKLLILSSLLLTSSIGFSKALDFDPCSISANVTKDLLMVRTYFLMEQRCDIQYFYLTHIPMKNLFLRKTTF